MKLTLHDEAALYDELHRLIGRRRGWVLFYQSQCGEGWAKRTAAGITLWHQSKLSAGGNHSQTVRKVDASNVS